MTDLGKMLIFVGLIIAGIGAVLVSGIGTGWLGKLPGDFAVEKPNFRFYFPLTTCLLISALLTLIMWLFKR